MVRYLGSKVGVTFKKVYGESKRLVISLVNVMLPLDDDDKKVESIEYLPPEMFRARRSTRTFLLTCCARRRGGRKFIVKMGMEWTKSLKQRVLLNASKTYWQGVVSAARPDNEFSQQCAVSISLNYGKTVQCDPKCSSCGGTGRQ